MPTCSGQYWARIKAGKHCIRSPWEWWGQSAYGLICHLPESVLAGSWSSGTEQPSQVLWCGLWAPCDGRLGISNIQTPRSSFLFPKFLLRQRWGSCGRSPQTYAGEAFRFAGSSLSLRNLLGHPKGFSFIFPPLNLALENRSPHGGGRGDGESPVLLCAIVFYPCCLPEGNSDQVLLVQ